MTDCLGSGLLQNRKPHAIWVLKLRIWALAVAQGCRSPPSPQFAPVSVPGQTIEGKTRDGNPAITGAHIYHYNSNPPTLCQSRRHHRLHSDQRVGDVSRILPINSYKSGIYKSISQNPKKITCQVPKPHKLVKTIKICIAKELFPIRYN